MNRPASVAIVPILGLMLSGCMTAAAIHQHQESLKLERLRVFDPAAHAWSVASGPTTSGRLALTASFKAGYGGVIQRVPDEVLTCAGKPIRLIPDSEHMRWLMDWHHGLKANGRGDWKIGMRRDPDEWAWPEPASAAYVRETTCDSDGRFEFASTPPGRYLVWAKITPTADRVAYDPYDLVLRAVEVKPGEALDIHIQSDEWFSGPLLPR